MLCCLNPDCPSPLNPDGNLFCQSCSVRLITLLRGHYRIINLLSNEGGFGRTYLAEDVDKLNERCVVKQLAPKVQGTWAQKKAMELFQEEAKRLQELGEHHQIPTLLAYFEQDHNMYLVQQFIDGENLLKELETTGIHKEVEIKQLLLDLLPVLKFIHERQVIHRDIKPQNIIRRKSNRSLVLIDFGASKQLTATVHAKMGTTIGSHGYSPVEQIKSGEAYPASDLFSLGATCFHLLTGISPFQLWVDNGFGWVKDWQQYLSSPVSSQLGEVLDKLLKKEIGERYQSADEVIRDLTSPVSPQPIPPTQPIQPQPPVPPTQPRQTQPPPQPSVAATVTVKAAKILRLPLQFIVPLILVAVVGALAYLFKELRSPVPTFSNAPSPTPTIQPTEKPATKRTIDNLSKGWVIQNNSEIVIIQSQVKFPSGTFFQVIDKKPKNPKLPKKDLVVNLRVCPNNQDTANPAKDPSQTLPEQEKTVTIELSELKRSELDSGVTVLQAEKPNPCVPTTPEPVPQTPGANPKSDNSSTESPPQ
ncbi:protein kinase [Calothrix sp. NIES-2100]|nr:protein kinase [Calothrix sp. NIES-2100]